MYLLTNVALGSLPSANVALADFMLGFSFQGFGFGGLARGGWVNQENMRLGEPGGATSWALHIDKKSKNPISS